MDIKSEKELIEWVYDMHLQNLSGREDFTEAFKEGIEATIEELKELKFLNLDFVTQRSELLKGDYCEHFIHWKDKYFIYEPKTYEYKSKDKEREYTLKGLHKMYERAMLQSPFNCG